MQDGTMQRFRLGAQRTDDEIAPLQAAALDGRLLIKRCRACGQPHWHPRALCPFCFSDDTAWEDSTGLGTIYTYSIVRRSPTGPYALAYIRLDDGPLMLSQVVDCRIEDVGIGKRVCVTFQATQDGPPLPVFRLSP